MSLALALWIHNKQSKNVTGDSESGSTMWGHWLVWLPCECDGSGAFGAGSPHRPRQIREYLSDSVQVSNDLIIKSFILDFRSDYDYPMIILSVWLYGFNSEMKNSVLKKIPVLKDFPERSALCVVSQMFLEQTWDTVHGTDKREHPVSSSLEYANLGYKNTGYMYSVLVC